MEAEDSSKLTSEPRSWGSWQTHLIMEIAVTMSALWLNSSAACILFCKHAIKDIHVSKGGANILFSVFLLNIQTLTFCLGAMIP